MKKQLALIAISAISLNACAAVVEGTRQKLNVSTNTTTRGTCSLQDSKNMTYQVNSPGVIEVNRGDGPLMVKCTTDEGTGSKVVNEGVEPWIFGNLFIPFVWPLTFAYDGFSGAYQRYPDDVNVSIVSNTAPVPEGSTNFAPSSSSPYNTAPMNNGAAR